MSCCCRPGSPPAAASAAGSNNSRPRTDRCRPSHHNASHEYIPAAQRSAHACRSCDKACSGLHTHTHTLLLRYGTWPLRCCSADTTSPRALRLLLMAAASLRRSPSAPLRDTRSLPARSIRCSLDDQVVSADGDGSGSSSSNRSRGAHQHVSETHPACVPPECGLWTTSSRSIDCYLPLARCLAVT